MGRHCLVLRKTHGKKQSSLLSLQGEPSKCYSSNAVSSRIVSKENTRFEGQKEWISFDVN